MTERRNINAKTWLQVAVRRSGWTQVRLCQELDVSEPLMSAWLTGRKSPEDPERLADWLAGRIGVEPERLRLFWQRRSWRGERVCEWCQTPYHPRTSQQRFCKVACRKAEKRSRGPDSHPWSRPRACLHCEGPVAGRARYCSEPCREEKLKELKSAKRLLAGGFPGESWRLTGGVQQYLERSGWGEPSREELEQAMAEYFAKGGKITRLAPGCAEDALDQEPDGDEEAQQVVESIVGEFALQPLS